MKKTNGTPEAALKAWWECVELGAKQDMKVNNLLMRICWDNGITYLYGDEHDNDDDPIWHTICNLTNSQRREFIKECKRIARG